jgi:hypothetical protein
VARPASSGARGRLLVAKTTASTQSAAAGTSLIGCIN